jgi:2-polyprenyl-3-methyl-5-hydroxy-6-metoxy-1,4-benzoquinol methylase
MRVATCRACDSVLTHTFVDLGLSPLANSYVTAEKLGGGETFYPLHVYICDRCFLVQLESFESPEEIFSDYAYFSSYSATWLKHAEAYAAAMADRFGLSAASKVIEVASNDGYLLQFFQKRGIPVLGIEPAANVAKVARERGIATEVTFFGRQSAEKLRATGQAADLMAANNVLAHVPDLLDFLAGFPIMLKAEGVVTFEFPHVLRMIEMKQFDTIYHEHFSYLSLQVVVSLLKRVRLRVFDVEALATHGGSLRVFACHDDASHQERQSVRAVLEEEERASLSELRGYGGFADSVVSVKCQALDFLIKAHQAGKLVCGYGAAAKGNTFINYCGIGPELLRVVADRSPHKQNTWLPGSRIPVVSPEAMLAMRPDYVLALPWNLKDEIAAQLNGIREWGGRFVTAVPDLTIF